MHNASVTLQGIWWPTSKKVVYHCGCFNIISTYLLSLFKKFPLVILSDLQTLSNFNQISFQLMKFKYQSLRHVIQKCTVVQGKPFQMLHNLALKECINSNGPNKHVIYGVKLNKLHAIPRPLNLFQHAGFNPSKETEVQISHSPSSILQVRKGH